MDVAYPFSPWKSSATAPRLLRGKLQWAGTLLFGNFPGYRAVHFVGEPVLASHCFQLQNAF